MSNYKNGSFTRQVIVNTCKNYFTKKGITKPATPIFTPNPMWTEAPCTTTFPQKNPFGWKSNGNILLKQSMLRKAIVPITATLEFWLWRYYGCRCRRTSTGVNFASRAVKIIPFTPEKRIFPICIMPHMDICGKTL